MVEGFTAHAREVATSCIEVFPNIGVQLAPMKTGCISDGYIHTMMRVNLRRKDLLERGSNVEENLEKYSLQTEFGYLVIKTSATLVPCGRNYISEIWLAEILLFFILNVRRASEVRKGTPQCMKMIRPTNMVEVKYDCFV